MHFLMPPVKSIRSVFIFKDFLPHLDVLSSSPIHPVFYDNFPGIRPCVASRRCRRACLGRVESFIKKITIIVTAAAASTTLCCGSSSLIVIGQRNFADATYEDSVNGIMGVRISVVWWWVDHVYMVRKISRQNRLGGNRHDCCCCLSR